MKKIKLVAIWNPKGGQGKSMLAINIAAAAVDMGIKPLIICQDQQGTSMLYYQEGNLPFKVIGEIPPEKPDADLVIFDHQASDWEVPDTHLLIMPLKPARDQFATYLDALKRAEKKQKEVITVVTDVKDNRASELAIREFLEEKGAFVIPSSGVFSRASDEYRTIFDTTMDKAYKVKERRNEIKKILGAILMEQTPDAQLEKNGKEEHAKA